MWTPREVRKNLRAAIERTYEVFSRYPLVGTMAACACGCVTTEDQARIRSKSLRGLCGKDLGRYTFKAMTTWGTVEDFRHFLPRILELVAYTGRVHYVDPEIALGKVRHGEWHAWPAGEQEIIRAYLTALWQRAFMMTPVSGFEALNPRVVWTSDTCLCAIAQVVDDLAPFLETWRRTPGVLPALHVAAFIEENFDSLALEGRLGNAFWEEREVQEVQVKTWLFDPSTRDRLQGALSNAVSPAVADTIARALDRFGRLAAEFRRPAAPLQTAVSTLLVSTTMAHPRRWVFVTVSGAHLYGFPSADSDYDLRGAHVLPATAVLGLDLPPETVEVSEEREGVRVELVTHDVKKYFRLLLNRNGYVLEQIFSPLVIETSREHEELKVIAQTCITLGHAQHYLGFAEQQWQLLHKQGATATLGPTVKAMLYVYRVLLTGIHLMRTGRVEANILRLNEEFRLPQIPDLVARKVSGAEAEGFSGAGLALHEREYLRLRGVLAVAATTSSLPAHPTGREALNDLLLRLRKASEA